MADFLVIQSSGPEEHRWRFQSTSSGMSGVMHDLTHRVITARHLVGDQVVLDAIEVARLAQPIPVRARGRGVRISWLRDAWRCIQPTVSRRLAAINAAPPELGLGRLERVRFTRGWWRLLEVQP